MKDTLLTFLSTIIFIPSIDNWWLSWQSRMWINLKIWIKEYENQFQNFKNCAIFLFFSEFQGSNILFESSFLRYVCSIKFINNYFLFVDCLEVSYHCSCVLLYTTKRSLEKFLVLAQLYYQLFEKSSGGFRYFFLKFSGIVLCDTWFVYVGVLFKKSCMNGFPLQMKD